MTPEQVQQMTKDERRDWLARAMGWTYSSVWLPNGDKIWERGGFAPEFGMQPYEQHPSHPIPDTLDAAAKCLPEGVVWLKERVYSLKDDSLTLYFRVYRPDGDWSYNITPTNDETNDRFALAILAISAGNLDTKR